MLVMVIIKNLWLSKVFSNVIKLIFCDFCWLVCVVWLLLFSVEG